MECSKVQEESPISDLLGGHCLIEVDSSIAEEVEDEAVDEAAFCFLFLFNRSRALERALTVSSQAGRSQSSCCFMNMSRGDDLSDFVILAIVYNVRMHCYNLRSSYLKQWDLFEC